MLLINQILVMTSLSNLLNLGNLIGPRKIGFGLDSISNPNQTPFKPQIEAHLVGAHQGPRNWPPWQSFLKKFPPPHGRPSTAIGCTQQCLDVKEKSTPSTSISHSCCRQSMPLTILHFMSHSQLQSRVFQAHNFPLQESKVVQDTLLSILSLISPVLREKPKNTLSGRFLCLFAWPFSILCKYFITMTPS